jgi:ATP-dependent Zn protease
MKPPRTAAKKRNRRTADQIRHTAYHEAGHAVAHRVVGMVCGEASIIADYKLMFSGPAIAEDHYAAGAAWDQRKKYRPQRSVFVGRIIGFMAGREAEIIAFGDHNGGDGDDRKQIVLMTREANISKVYLERLRPKVGLLLRRHWPNVEAVAQALRERKKLSGAEIDAIIDRVTTSGERRAAERVQVARDKNLREKMARWHKEA